MSMLVTQSDVGFFNSNGYWISPPLFSSKDLISFQEAMEKIYQEDYNMGWAPAGGWNYREGDPNGLRKTDSVHLADRTLYQLSTNSSIGAICRSLMQVSSVRLYDTQLLYKPGNPIRTGNSLKSGNVGWHQDFVYWQKSCLFPSLITAWVAFDDVTIEKGAMHVVPGSHRWGLLEGKSKEANKAGTEGNDFFNQNIEEQQANMKSPDGKYVERIPLELKAGQVSFHHCYTYHGSGPNITDTPRRSLAIHLLCGLNFYISTQKFDPYPAVLGGLKDGDTYEGQFFPELI